MQLDASDTIAAIASAPGGALRGILRISGPRTLDCLEGCFAIEDSLRESRAARIHVGSLRLSESQILPSQLYLWPTERSYTRQITAEIHTLGSPALLESALAAICRCGARLAEPGEFTLRAFLAGRLDLTQAEAVLGVIDARSQTELDTALVQLAGGLAGPLDRLRGGLLDLLAHLEAGLDFVDEDIEFISSSELHAQLAAAEQEIEEIAAKMSSRGETAGQPRVVIFGAPNVGKSSLLNALAGSEAAIVADAAGTTRDYVVRSVAIDGLSCLLIDTAGVDSIDFPASIAAAAQAMTAEQTHAADLQLFCLDSTRGLTAWEREQLDLESNIPRLLVYTKCDMNRIPSLRHGPSILTSSRTGQGLADLRRAIAAQLQTSPAESSVVAGTAARCRESLTSAGCDLARARQALHDELGEEVVAAEIRAALEELGRVVGAVYTDDILDRIFSRFCIGK